MLDCHIFLFVCNALVVTKKAKIEQGGKEQKTETSATVARMTSSAALTGIVKG